jgi:polyvinyl alcohol dehydrogenase (cytochrome)
MRIPGNRPRRRLRRSVLVILGLAALAVIPQTFAAASETDWPTYGHDPADTRNQPLEHDISTANVGQLASKWTATTTGDVSGTPAVVDGAVYFGDFGGTVWKLDASTGAVIWSHAVSDYTGATGDYARTSPSLDGNVLIVGTNKGPFLLGIDATTGALLWKTQVNPDLHGTMTGSPTLVGDTVITGISASGASGPNAIFRGDIAAVNALTGQLLWESFSMPDNGGVPGGYAGATMFSAPAVDEADGLVFGTFGNPYTEPASVAACNAAAPDGFSESCEQPGAYWKSIVAFDLKTGAPVWSYRVFGDAPVHRVCDAQPVSWCFPATDAEKWDIGGSSPNVFELGTGSSARTVVGFGGKSGVYYLFDAKTGALLWNTLVGPGGDQGGFEWGSAYDGQHIYVSLTNQHHISYNLTENGQLTSTTATGGSWAALDPATGKILWQTADPQTETLASGTVGVWDLAPVTSANGVVYVASMAKSGSEMYALDAATGSILWQYSAGSSVNAAPAVVDGSVYWGSGYSRAAEGSGNTKLFAFSIGGVSDTTAPTTTIALDPSTPNGSNGWYKTKVGVSITAADNSGGVGVFQTRCALDPTTAPSSFADLPDADCSLTRVDTDGTHTIYAASEDKDNNVESPVVSTTFKIDATPPTITAAATTQPDANGFYHGPVVVHFTCSDNGSGIPAGACPPDQTLTDVGLAVSSTPETVTDAAGNVSAPSNVVTVKIVTPTGLCSLTRSHVQGGTKYQNANVVQRTVANALVHAGCEALDAIGPHDNAIRKHILVSAYKSVVHVLEQQGWLTAAQASELDALANGL